MKAANSKRSLFMLLGLALLALWLLPSGMFSKILNRPGKRNTITKEGRALYLRLIQKFGDVNIAKYITAQAAHETGNFTSPLFIDHNNLFGMTFAGQALAENFNGYASYDYREDSITDFLNYYRINKYKPDYSTPDEYAAALRLNGYYTAPYREYLNGMKNFLNVYFNEDK